MAVVRVIAVDPFPRADESDLVIYQVPERSRAYELLTELLSKEGIEFVTIEAEHNAMPEEERKRRRIEAVRRYRERKKSSQ